MIEFEEYMRLLVVKPKRRVVAEWHGFPVAIDYEAKPDAVYFVDADDRVLGRIVNIGESA